MNTEEVEALVAKRTGELQAENQSLREQIAGLEEKVDAVTTALQASQASANRLAWQLSRRLFREEDWLDFDPKEFTTSHEEMLTAIESIVE